MIEKRWEHVYFNILDFSLKDDLGTSNSSSTTGSNETDLLTRRGITADSGRVTNVLMVTSSVRMVDGVHGHTTNSWPAVSLSFIFVESTAGFKDRLLDTASSSNNTDGTTRSRRDELNIN